MQNILCPTCNKEMKLKMKLKADILQCPSCKLDISIIEARPEDLIENVNDSERRKALYSLRMSNYENIINNLISVFKDNSKITGIEVGCGYGWFLEACSNHSRINCIGLEPQKEYIPLPTTYDLQYSKPQNKLNIINGYFPDDLPKNKIYDFIIFNDVFEHIPNIEMTVKNCYNYLSKNGIIIINLPLTTGFIYRISYIMYKLFGIDKYLNRLYQLDYISPHLYYFNKKI